MPVSDILWSVRLLFVAALVPPGLLNMRKSARGQKSCSRHTKQKIWRSKQNTDCSAFTY